jgi:hypothetical protein
METAWRWNVQVAQLRLLGDYHHSTQITFIEFVMVCSFSLISGQLLVISPKLKANQCPEICTALLALYACRMCVFKWC